MEKDIIINKLTENNHWIERRKSQYEKENQFILNSNIKGYHNRYRLEIVKLYRKHENNLYKVKIFYTPYNPMNLEFEGRFNTYEDLIEIIKNINTGLL